MAAFSDVEAEQPEFAARVRAVFDAHGHKVLATLRADGAPRVSGIEAAFAQATGNPPDGDYEPFHVDLEQVVLTAVSEAKDALEISSWRPGRGLTVVRRT